MPQIFLINSGNNAYYSAYSVFIPNTGDHTNIPPVINITNIENKYSGV